MNQPYRPRYTPQSPSSRVRPRSQEVIDYHYDEQKPGKPLWLLIPGALAALGSLALMLLIAALSYGNDPSIDPTLGTALIIALVPIYVGSVFLFSYGYELYDIPKAIRLTLIIVFITIAAVFMFAVLVFVLAALGKSKSSSSSSSSSSSRSSFSGGGTRGFLRGVGPIFINGSPMMPSVTREVVREVPVAPPAPQPIACTYCGRPYIPEESQYACPNCGAPAPQELAAQPSET
jgi:hypothetical protein